MVKIKKVIDFILTADHSAGMKNLCISNNESDLYIGSLDGRTDSKQYKKLLNRPVGAILLDTQTYSGSELVDIDIELVVSYQEEDDTL